MGTVREKILNALTLFYQAIKSVFVQTTNVVDNCASTSTSYPLSANQGTNLQGQIDDINSTLSTLIPKLLWSGASGSNTAIYLSESIENFNFITLIYQRTDGIYYNATYLTSILLKTNITNFAQQIFNTSTDGSLYMDSYDRTCIWLWMTDNLNLIAAYGH